MTSSKRHRGGTSPQILTLYSGEACNLSVEVDVSRVRETYHIFFFVQL